LYDRQNKGDKVDLVIRNKQEQKKRYEKALEELKLAIEREKVLTMTNPHFVGAIRIVPYHETKTGMKRDDAIEKLGMQIARRYEKEHGRKPEDVSLENLGLDIRSTDKDGKRRYIEVKARAKTGPILLTQNE